MKWLIVCLVLFCSVSAQESIGNFLLFTQKDPITDRNEVRIVAVSLGSGDARLIYRCRGDDFEIYISTDDFIDSDPFDGIVRFGNAQPREVRMSNSTNGTGGFLDDSLLSWFMRSSRQNTRLVIRVFNYRGTPYTYTFNIAGFANVERRLFCARRY